MPSAEVNELAFENERLFWKALSCKMGIARR